MSIAENKAVFLSYASQDADAARKIADALRGAGVEVWFDTDGGLEHGDEWDAKIRRQIKECVLFIPIISANTQAREEGYFRLEWDLAAERARTIASGVAFIMPVVIDDTREPDALVPDRFRMVQWTRLPGGVVTPEVKARYLKLWSHRIGAARLTQTSPPTGVFEARETPAPHPRTRRVSAAMWLTAALTIATIAGFIAFRPKATVDAGKAPAATAAPSSEAAKLAAEARRHYTGIFPRESLTLAEEFGRRATDLDPRLARAWAVRAGASAAYLMREFAQGEAAAQRAREAQAFASRALAIDPDDVEALIALGQVANNQGAVEQAEAYYRRVLTLEPNNLIAPRMLSIVLRRTKRVPEAVALMKEAVRRAPGDALTHFDLAYCYAQGWNFPKAYAECEAAATAQPFHGARVWQAWNAFQWKGDVALMRSLIDQVDFTHRGEEETVWMAMMCALFERRSDRVIEAAGRTASGYLEMWQMPKAWFTAQAYELDGKQSLARQEWQAAETVLRERLRAEPQNSRLRATLATTLARLGRAAEARADLAEVESLWREQMDGPRAWLLELTAPRAWSLACFYAASGEAATAVAWLRRTVNQGLGINAVTPHDLKLNPWWDGIRNSREFQALLANPPPAPAPVDEPAPVTAAGPEGKSARAGAGGSSTDAKSIAVLAFDNLSDDKANEYFSDGISEELINALGRVPGLTVKGRTSAFYFKGNRQVSSAEIAQQLGVAYLVRGSVRKDGSRVRISAQLTRAATDEMVWSSDPLTKEVQDVFAAQEEIAGLIARSLQLKLGIGALTAPPTSTEAMRAYLEGRQFWNLRTRAALDQAEKLFDQALTLDPKLGRARVGRADVWMQRKADHDAAGEKLGPFANRDSPLFAKITAEAEAALAEDPSLAEAHATIGMALTLSWQPAAAEERFRRALKLNSNYATAHQWLGRLLLREGRMDEARAELARAAELDPLSPIILDNYGLVMLLAGDPAAALPVVERALVFRPDSVQTLSWQTWALTDIGRIDAAVAVARRLAQNTNAALVIPRTFVRAGMKDEAEAFLRRPELADDERRLFALAGIGRPHDALTHLHPPTFHSNITHFLLFLPEFDPVREDPRFRRALEDLGLTQAHARAQAWRAAHPAGKREGKK